MSTHENFESRHIGPSHEQEATMLLELGFADLDSFIKAVVPENIAMGQRLADVLPPALSEVQTIAELRKLAGLNQVFDSFIGTGYYGTITPAVILRNVLENPAWYTAYTPYQPEISQGRLEALFAFQTAVCDLTALPIANASMLDEGTAAAEAMTLARRVFSGDDSAVFLIDKFLHPQTKAVVATRAKPLAIQVVEFDPSEPLTSISNQDVFGVLVQYPNTNGEILDYSALAAWAHERNALLIAATDLLALTLLTPPGEWGADIAVGSAQRFGVPMGFGGPHAGFLAVRNGLERSMPGRLIGQSLDAHGNAAFRLALQTREQHIRRDKATSNICTAQVLLAVMSAFYAMWHGPDGLKVIANRIHSQTDSLVKALASSDHKVLTQNFFDTVLIEVKDAALIHRTARSLRINLREVSANVVGISFDETITSEHLARIGQIFGVNIGTPAREVPITSARKSSYLTHPIFSTNRSETSMMRYLRTFGARPNHDSTGLVHHEIKCGYRNGSGYLAGVFIASPIRTG
jgi:glycine dehydrogenase